MSADNEYEYLRGNILYKYKLQYKIKLFPSLANSMYKSNYDIKRQFLPPPKETHTKTSKNWAMIFFPVVVTYLCLSDCVASDSDA